MRRGGRIERDTCLDSSELRRHSGSPPFPLDLPGAQSHPLAHQPDRMATLLAETSHGPSNNTFTTNKYFLIPPTNIVTKLPFLFPLSIVLLSVSSLLATAQQPAQEPRRIVVDPPTVPGGEGHQAVQQAELARQQAVQQAAQPGLQPARKPRLRVDPPTVPGGVREKIEPRALSPQPLDATALASFLNVHGGTFDLSTSGSQSRYCYRLIVYLDGKPVGETAWKSDSTQWGRMKFQRFTTILGNVDEGITFWVSHNSAVTRGTIKLETKLRPNYFPQEPITNKEGSISLAANIKDDVLKDSTPSTGQMVVVLETKESEDGADQPATRSESKSEGGDEPQPESKGRPR